MINLTAYQYHSQPSRSQGISLIAVMFILIVLGGLAAVMAQMGATQHTGYLLSKEGKQAYYSARSGLEWLQYHVDESNNCPPDDVHIEHSGFELHLTCEPKGEFQEGTDSLEVFHLSSEAIRESGPFGRVSRKVRASVWVRST